MYIAELICFNDMGSFDTDPDTIEIKKFKMYYQMSEFYYTIWCNQN